MGFTHFPSPGSPPGPHSHFFPSSGGTAPGHPQLPEPAAQRRCTLPKDLTVLQEKGRLTIVTEAF